MNNNIQNATNVVQITRYQSPCGELILGSFDGKLCLCDWPFEGRRGLIDKRIQKTFGASYEEASSEVIEQAIFQLEEYFLGKRQTFDVPLLFAGTDFQKMVWNGLRNIPYGTTRSYAAFAQELNKPKAIRAIAAANGANAISIFVPCHRVIGSNNELVGYAGGLSAKRLLLDLESSGRR